jgi:hypothetical protein
MHDRGFCNCGPSGGAQNTAAPETTVGIVGGTVEDVTGAIVPKAELTLKCPLPCRTQATWQAI